MRQLTIHVPRGGGTRVVEHAQSYEAVNVAVSQATDGRGQPLDVVSLSVSNARVGPLLEAVQRESEPHITFSPSGVFALQPPANEVPRQVSDVQLRSPLEIVLAGLQSIGSWRGFLSYAALGGTVAWIGLYSNTVYLLVAAMLLAPFAGPAMNTAIATAYGDLTLLRRSLLRYVAALAVTILAAFLLSLIFGQQEVTQTMVGVSKVGWVAALLPLTAGAAGAIFLIQSERSSLVSGAAVGLLVAASLAPPAALLGMLPAVGRWDLMAGGAFVLVLQLVGINLAGAAVFRLGGVRADPARFGERSRKGVLPWGLAVSGLALAGLLAVQAYTPLSLERGSRESAADEAVASAMRDLQGVQLVEVSSRFTRMQGLPDGALTVTALVRRTDGGGETDWQRDVEDALLSRLHERFPQTEPLVNVTAVRGAEDAEP